MELIPVLLIVAIVLLLVRSKGRVARPSAPDTSGRRCAPLNRAGSKFSRASWDLQPLVTTKGVARSGRRQQRRIIRHHLAQEQLQFVLCGLALLV
jgi:hypothetical protein